MDRENVIKGLEICSAGEWNSTGGRDHTDCPYYPAGYTGCTCKLLMRDALALLKEQEAVEPKKVKGYNPPMYTIYEYECEKCKSPMMNKQPFCMGCGRSVKWDG